MQVICPGCSSRYKLDDSKIKASGTKVRCPKCTKSFLVYPTSAQDKKEAAPKSPSNEETAPPQSPPPRKEVKTQPPRRQDAETEAPKKKVSAPAAPPPPPPAPPEDEDPFNERTIVSDHQVFTKENLGKLKKDRQQEKREAEASRSEIEESDDPLDDATVAVPEEARSPFRGAAMDPSRAAPPPIQDPGEPEESSEAFRPFGDATLLEIQKMGRKKGGLRLPLKSLAAGLVFVALGAAAYWGWNQWSGGSESQAFVTHNIFRPSGWYEHEPSVYQSVLTQMAALPRDEQESPENRALLAESLILNGLLAGDSNQILSGLGIATSLSVIFPNSPISFYGVSAYAIGQNDVRTIQDLFDRWPESHRDDPEFEVLAIIHFARSGQIEEALRRAQQLLAERPDFVRGKIHSLQVALQNPELAEKILGTEQIESLKTAYRNHRDSIATQVASLPKFYQDTNRLLGDRVQSGPPASQSSAQEKKTLKEESEPVEPESSQAPTADLIVDTATKEPPPNPVEIQSNRPRKSASGLPLASPELLAQAQDAKDSERLANSAMTKGNRSFEQGNLDEALRHYRDALKANAELADAYRQIGRIYMQRKEAARALRSFKIYLQLAPNSSDKNQVEQWIASLE